jgi:hypothetical protein
VRIAANSDASPTRAFFLPGTSRNRQEEEYVRLRQCAMQATGFEPTPSRIHQIACRLGGRDCTIEVGKPGPLDGAKVVAILDLGRELNYGVFTTADQDALAMEIGKRVYTVTPFR